MGVGVGGGVIVCVTVKDGVSGSVSVSVSASVRVTDSDGVISPVCDVDAVSSFVTVAADSVLVTDSVSLLVSCSVTLSVIVADAEGASESVSVTFCDSDAVASSLGDTDGVGGGTTVFVNERDGVGGGEIVWLCDCSSDIEIEWEAEISDVTLVDRVPNVCVGDLLSLMVRNSVTDPDALLNETVASCEPLPDADEVAMPEIDSVIVGVDVKRDVSVGTNVNVSVGRLEDDGVQSVMETDAESDSELDSVIEAAPVADVEAL